MSFGLEDLVTIAKRTNAVGAGAAADYGYGVLFYDFGKVAASGSVGQKKTGLLIPANTLIESGLLRVDTAFSGGFNLQLIAAGDVLPAQGALAAGAITNVVRLFNPTQERELLINVSAAAAGKILVWLRCLPC